MNIFTKLRSPAHPRLSGKEGRFTAFALIVSIGLVMLGLFVTAQPRHDLSLIDALLFVLRP